jgi:predicted enzyme related to lactoylglutathione lyase
VARRRDAEHAKKFYSRVVAWKYKDSEILGSSTAGYVSFTPG